MIERRFQSTVLDSLAKFSVVGLIGARQVGKTTLAHSIAARFPGTIYLDLERPTDAAKLTEAELYLQQHARALVILDEVQRQPGLFPVIARWSMPSGAPGGF